MSFTAYATRNAYAINAFATDIADYLAPPPHDERLSSKAEICANLVRKEPCQNVESPLVLPPQLNTRPCHSDFSIYMNGKRMTVRMICKSQTK
jgi:DNA-binding LytR/AlgR family response regulator